MRKLATGVLISCLAFVSVIPLQAAASCVDLSGTWVSTALGTVTQTLTTPGDPNDSGTATGTFDPRGWPVEGTATFVQTGCSVQFTPAPATAVLTSQQAAELQRTMTVTGTSVTVTGPLTLPQLTTPGFTITQVVENQIQGSGQLSGGSLTLVEQGTFQGSGTFSVNGHSGTFTVVLTVSATETLVPQLMLPPGVITTVAGNGPSCPGAIFGGVKCGGFSGDGGPATAASLNGPSQVAVDGSGNLFIADTFNNRIRKVSASTGIITTVAGNGTGTLGLFSGDGGSATSAPIDVGAIGMAVDAAGNLFIADTYNQRIRKVSASTGIITTVAGNGVAAFLGDGGPATSASLSYPNGVAVDAAGNLFIADSTNYRVRKVSASTGIITTVAGNGTEYLGGFSAYCFCETNYLLNGGDYGPATAASINAINVAVDGSGNVFVGDEINAIVRMVSASTGIITTVAGNGNDTGFSGDGGPAALAELDTPASIAVDTSGDLFIADNSQLQEVPASPLVREYPLSPPPNLAGGNVQSPIFLREIATIVGGSGMNFSGDGGPATSAGVCTSGVAIDTSGNIFIADGCNNRIRKVSAFSEISGSTLVTSVGNGASFTQSFAPGMLMSAFGTGLSSGSPQTVTTAPLPVTSLSGTSVSINGIPAPLLYISATQINLQIPYEVSAGSAVLKVYAGGQTASISFTIRAAAPGIFVDSKTGHIVPNESASAGATIGFFVTGAGQVTPSEATGNVPDEGTIPVPNLPLTMTVGGVPVTPVYAGIPDWSVGVLQINFTVPMNVPGGAQPVIVTIGGVASNAALMTVTPP